MTTLSPARAAVPLIGGLPLIGRGKVRDTYRLGTDHLLSCATDALSIFDFLLNTLVPEKGPILTAMSHFWFTKLAEHGIRTHLVAAGATIDQYLPEALRGNPDLQSRATVVRRLDMFPAEFVARQCLTGTGLGEYLASGTVCGTMLPPGLQDGDRLPYIMDTPTTKAALGHDMPLNAAGVRRQYPEATFQLLRIFQIITTLTEKRGFVLADTKMEFGLDGEGNVTLGDEVVTPDSSRFWLKREWEKSRLLTPRTAPTANDKQRARDYGKGLGIHRRNPELPEDVAWVHGLSIPEDIIRATTMTYRYIFWRLTGLTLENYQAQRLGIAVAPKRKRVAIIFGSESDRPVLEEARCTALHHFLDGNDVQMHVISCHRNPDDLQQFARERGGSLDVIIAAGSKAFALPGAIDALLHAAGHEVPVIGVALGKEGSASRQAAEGSISELPGQPVIMDEIADCVYGGVEGFNGALERVFHGELPPPVARTQKPAQMDLAFNLMDNL